MNRIESDHYQMKLNIIEYLESLFKEELKQIQVIAAKSKANANDSEMKQESKYDTRKVEASYLAGAQAKRVSELEHDLTSIRNLNLTSTASPIIAISSLVVILQNQEIERNYFLSPTSGGIKWCEDETEVSIVSTQSPIGQAMLKLEEGETFELQTPNSQKEIEILRVF
ncbi:MAG: hypothetical protein ACI9QD_000280 [Thermoproteota archaeon]|jgi:hypothetical protein